MSSRNKNKDKEEQNKTTSFSSLGENAKVTLRMKVTMAQLQQLDNKETITVPFKGRNLEITCKGKAESE